MRIDITKEISKSTPRPGKIYPGQGIVLYIELTDKATGSPTNDPTLKLRVRDEGGGTLEVLNGSLANPATGRYEYTHKATAGGKTFVDWISETTQVFVPLEYRVQHIKDCQAIPDPQSHLVNSQSFSGSVAQSEPQIA